MRHGLRLRRAFAGGCLAAGALAGCQAIEDLRAYKRCDPITPGAIPAPVGTHLGNIFSAQEFEAEKDDYVLYQTMWYQGGKLLGPEGAYRLELIGRKLPYVPFPVVIQPSGNPELDLARRKAVIDYLAGNGVADAGGRVVVARPIAEGLEATEAAAIFNRGVPEARTRVGGSGLGNTFGGQSLANPR